MASTCFREHGRIDGVDSIRVVRRSCRLDYEKSFGPRL